jgi:hypothetical protein
VIRQRVARTLVKVPGLRGLYLKALLRTLENTPPSKLPPELRQLKQMLGQVPASQRLDFLKAGLRGELPRPAELSREMRRAAERQSRRAR